MQLCNNTKSQHFVSQVEQRFNAINPDASKRKQKIYSFTINDRENYKIKLDCDKGIKIYNTLALGDLFSFDIVDNEYRNNLESIFQQHEDNIDKNTKSLINKLKTVDPNIEPDIKNEVLNLFVSKILNFLRNPYSIKKVLNTIGSVLQYRPVNQELNEICKLIETGRKPQQKRLCSQSDISDNEYEEWIRALFMMLSRPNDNSPNMLEDIVKSLYENKSHFNMVFVFHYEAEQADKVCLLSDRGYLIPIEEKDCHFAFGFNLCSNAFIYYFFTNIEQAAKVQAHYIPDMSDIPEETLNKIIERYKGMRNNVKVEYKKNNLEALSTYNRNVIYQCHKKVYAAKKVVYGLQNNI